MGLLVTLALAVTPLLLELTGTAGALVTDSALLLLGALSSSALGTDDLLFVNSSLLCTPQHADMKVRNSPKQDAIEREQFKDDRP